MKSIWILLLVGTLFCAGLFVLSLRYDNDDNVCNFCSGSGQGEDCPLHDKEARNACLDSVHSHYCGQRPKDCG